MDSSQDTVQALKPRKMGTTPDEIREYKREWSRQYYRMHRREVIEKNKEYARTHTRKNNKRKAKTVTYKREQCKSSYTASDLMHLPAESLPAIIDKIIRGERVLSA